MHSRTARAAGNFPSARINAASEIPRMYSITRNGGSRSEQTSYTITTCGCCSWAAERASTNSESRSRRSAARAGFMTLMATARRSTGSNPSNTIPMPPRPTGPTIWNRPRLATNGGSPGGSSPNSPAQAGNSPRDFPGGRRTVPGPQFGSRSASICVSCVLRSRSSSGGRSVHWSSRRRHCGQAARCATTPAVSRWLARA